MSAVIETKPKLRKLSAILKQVEGVKKTYDTEPDCSTDDGYKESKEKANELKAIRVEAEKARKSEKAKHLAAGAAVDVVNKKILAYVEPREEKYKSAYVAVDDEKARAKQAKIDAEQAEADAMQARFDDLDNLALDSHELPEVIAAIEKLDTLDLQPFQDRAEEAETKVEKLLEILNRRKERLQAEADAAAVVEQQRIENEKAADKLAAEQKKQADAQAEQQRKLDEQAAEIQKEKDKLAAEKNKIAEDARIKKAAEQATKDATEKAERERVTAAKQAEADKQAAVIQTRKDEQARATAEVKRIADEKVEAAKRAALAPVADQLRNWFESLPLPPVVTIDPNDGDTIAAHNEIVDSLVRMNNATAQLVERTKEAA